jgi:aminoglycoside phosphotransferase (APT) family kinase protein
VNTDEIAAQIAALLRAQVPGAADADVTEVKRVFGGNARRAWACQAAWTGPDGRRRDEELIMLSRPPGSQVQVEPRREYDVLRALHDSAVRAPRVWALDALGEVTGASSVVLQRLPGHTDAVAFLRDADGDQGRGLTEDLARAAAELHTADLDRVDGVLDAQIRADGSLDARATAIAQVEHWRTVFLASRMEPLPTLDRLFGWLLDHAPEPARLCVVHGDLRPGNFLYLDDTVIALLDWEMVHLGDPVEDLAWVYRPLWSPERFLDLESFVHRYETSGGPAVDPDALVYHRILAEVKFATISVRAARAFADGTTTNLRLADRAATVTPALTLAWELLGRLKAPAGIGSTPC